MSLQSNISEVVAAIGADVKATVAAIGAEQERATEAEAAAIITASQDATNKVDALNISLRDYVDANNGGTGVARFKNPTYTYLGDEVVRIDYSTGEYVDISYSADFDISTIHITDGAAVSVLTFSYSANGSLSSVVES